MVVYRTMAVDVMRNLVNQHVIKIKVPNIFEVLVTNVERVGTQENTRLPVNAVTTQGTGPASLLLARACEQKNTSKVVKVFTGHLTKTLLNLLAVARMEKLWCEGRQTDHPRKFWLGRHPAIEPHVCSTCLGEERIVSGPVRELGPAVCVASWTGRLGLRAHWLATGMAAVGDILICF
jgi:hypothetical protein